jgi:hypothetical protein
MLRNELKGLTHYQSFKTCNGYNLYTPLHDQRTLLIDMQGRLVHHWDTGYLPGCHGYMLPNGNLVYAGKTDTTFATFFGGSNGVMLEFDWDGNEVWRYEDPFMNHDFWRKDNGNTLVLRWEVVPEEIASKVKGGVPGSEFEGKMWATQIHEVAPDGDIVWEWSAYEHLDPEKDYICPICWRAEWDHSNSILAMPNEDVMIISRPLHQLILIDHKTGAIKGKWGRSNIELAHPHNPSLLDNGNILLFDNGLHRPLSSHPYSRVLEIDLDKDEIVWEYQDPTPYNFYSPLISGAQRLSNGNTLICEGMKGRFFEVTPEKEIVWEYINPVAVRDTVRGMWGYSSAVFRVHRYAPDFPGLQGRDLDPSRHAWWNNIYGTFNSAGIV